MTAATKNRNTPSRASTSRGYPVASGVHALAGTIAVLSATGFAEPATTATGKITLGCFDHECNNTNGPDGGATANVKRGYFRFENSLAADEITLTDLGQTCYLVDNQTVAKTDGTGTRSIAGIVDDIDDQGVWVLLDPTSGVAL
ncbi:hypothetical protein [Spongiibacter sp. UBA1325]|uniref:hypothetical protein n=1 Tax=Spongiibacter sp. UBA1325 TaxID=1947543 RepID=UPI00257A4D2B|nr:hypothetical protein [Spongiibacter sp. UBA1325]